MKESTSQTVTVEFLISNVRSQQGWIDLRDKRGGVDEMATLITKRLNQNWAGCPNTEPLRFLVGRYFVSKPVVMKVLLTKVDRWVVINDQK